MKIMKINIYALIEYRMKQTNGALITFPDHWIAVELKTIYSHSLAGLSVEEIETHVKSFREEFEFKRARISQFATVGILLAIISVLIIGVS